jgi:hypothetical protein
MITSRQIEKLTNLERKDYMISSLYLRLWPDQRIHQTKAKAMIRKKSEEFEQGYYPLEERRWIEKDLNKIQEFVETVRESPSKGLAIFSSTAEEVWEIFFLPRPVPDLLVLDSSARVFMKEVSTPFWWRRVIPRKGPIVPNADLWAYRPASAPFAVEPSLPFLTLWMRLWQQQLIRIVKWSISLLEAG